MKISDNNHHESPDHSLLEAKRGKCPSPKILDADATVWRDKNTYGSVLIERFLEPLRSAKSESGQIPRALQNSVLRELQSYFTTDLRERSPTVVVTEQMAVEFHALVKEIMSYVELDMISAIDENLASQEVKHALLSYKTPQCYSPVVLDAYDYDQKLVRLSYFIHGTPPSETFLINGERVEPAYQKYRACRFFRRMLLRQRIVWLPVCGNKAVQVLLNGKASELAVGSSIFLPSAHKQGTTSQSLQAVRSFYPPGKGKPLPIPWNLTGLKVRAVRWLAHFRPVRRKFSKAWIFIDRETEADDNAEHLYRWVKENHPEINAWFLLDRASNDWERLNVEGFRLMPQGWLRKLLILNAEQIISSHAEYVYGGFDRRYYADMMTWCSTFIPHGISKDDVSHWLNELGFDKVTTTSPAEYSSFVDDDTPYIFTRKEVHLTGFPRQDKLLYLSKKVRKQDVNSLLIMPTWRGSLVDERAKTTSIESSLYVQRWRSLLNNEELISLSEKYGINIIFFPHTNAIPYLNAFNIPKHVETLTKETTGVLPTLCRSRALITDYTSVAFEMANLRRTTFYYQFDRLSFYGGDHNWRQGYFDYDRDGFGPIAFQESELLSQLKWFFSNGAQSEPKYLKRMEIALPLFDGQACWRTYEAITQLEMSPHKKTQHYRHTRKS